MKIKDLKKKRNVRHRRIRAKVKGTKEVPRLSIFRSSKHIQLQVINDSEGKTILGFTDAAIKKGSKSERAKSLGKIAAGKILDKKIKKVVFDRGGYRYHGRIKALAEALREEGIEF